MDTVSTISTGSATVSSGTADFKGQCGECSNGYFSATSTGGMQPGQSATVNGNPPQNCVVANDGATVFGIELARIAGIYSYQVRVDAQGPSGPFSGSMYLAFQDATGDIYYLSIYSSTREGHEVSFNSGNPNIVKIFWSDNSFTVRDGVSNRPKPQYQVVSPAGRAG
ncbi:MAG TPA: hypothetical protein VF548_11925 [Allosphingosinicella sp.]|jgi:hypothetical protein